MGTLYVVGTPIGNLKDLSDRALAVLRDAELVAAEDTRVTGRLLASAGLRRPMVSYRAPVERRALPRLLEALEHGDVALVSDAGTPGISDPGQLLVSAAAAAGHPVLPVPGPSAVGAAVSVSGFGGAGYCFTGYLPRKAGELRRFYRSIEDSERPVVAFESPYRISKSLTALAEVMPDRAIALGRELTKLHEEVLRGTPAEVLAALKGRERGEFTLVISGV
jgi:16S rRNA (cytidine1402-2'-O)-methyltransferase